MKQQIQNLSQHTLDNKNSHPKKGARFKIISLQSKKTMVKVIFYEKPGCINNTKQKALLTTAGHQVEAHSLLTTSWTPETLRPFFGQKPVVEWFNYTAPRIKSGEVIPNQLDEARALSLMIADPLLIRRPLIQVAEIYQVGFDPAQIDAWIGLNPEKPITEDLETCPRSQSDIAGDRRQETGDRR